MSLNLRSVDLNLLASFDALMIEENLSRAADRLGMSQPAMSAALQRLRLTFHDELFVRSRQGMIPTPRARTVYPQIREALALIRGALTQGERFDPATAAHSFRLLADNYFEAIGLGPLMARLRRAGAGLAVETFGVEGDIHGTLRRLEADLLIDYVRIEADYLQAQEIGSERLVVIARKGHPRVRGSLSLDQYLAEEHVFLPLRSRERSQLEQALGGQALPRRRAVQVQHFSSMLPVVAATDYLAVLPARLQALYASSFKLQCFDFPLAIPPIPIWMMWPAVLSDDPAQRWFRGELQAVAMELQASL